MMHTSNDKSKQYERQSSLWTKQNPITKPERTPSWQIARDISTAILWRQSTRLSSKQEITSSSTKGQVHAGTKPNQSPVYRTPRMPTEREAALIEIAYESICSYCDGPCIGEYIRCRVCIKIYHRQCLFQRGYLTNQTIPLRRLAKQDWNCPDCSDLTRLLHHDELLHLIHAFDQIDRNKDGYIILDEFLSFQSNKTISDGLELFIQHNDDLGKKYFSLMDSTRQGVVAWSDFILLYTCKFIAVKDKIELTTKLTDKELVIARCLFLKDPKKSFDDEYHRIITREYFNRVHRDLILLLNKKYGLDFIDAILGYDHRTEATSYEKPSMVYWQEFLRELSLFFLLNRSNDDVVSIETHRATIPPHLANLPKVFYPTLMPMDNESPRKLTLSRSGTISSAMFPTLSCDKTFLKHAKLLDKLNQRNRAEELKRKQLGSSVSYTIVENNDREENINLPKLKPNARDDRRSITDPWTSVKELQQLRTELILLTTSRS